MNNFDEKQLERLGLHPLSSKAGPRKSKELEVDLEDESLGSCIEILLDAWNHVASEGGWDPVLNMDESTTDASVWFRAPQTEEDVIRIKARAEENKAREIREYERLKRKYGPSGSDVDRSDEPGSTGE